MGSYLQGHNGMSKYSPQKQVNKTVQFQNGVPELSSALFDKGKQLSRAS